VEPDTLVRFLSAGTIVVGGLFFAVALVYGRLSAISRRRLYTTAPRPLDPTELESLQLWQRRTVWSFVATMAGLAVYALSFGFARWLPRSLYGVECVGVISLALAGLTVLFSECCPVCGRRIGLQSTLLLPSICEICGAVFRPQALLATAAAGYPRSMRLTSPIRIFGWPLFAIAYGSDPQTGQGFGVARAVVAVGDVAVGVVAVGGLAIGVIPVGGVSVGLLSIGGVAIGLGAVGGLAAGELALGGLAFGSHALGGIAVGPHVLGALTAGAAAPQP
jgi:hypothetical protein